MEKKYDLRKEMIGPIIGFSEDKPSKTGYQIHMLIRDKECVFDATQAAYSSIKDSKEFAQYPCLGELLYLPTFDENHVITEIDFAIRLVRYDTAITTSCTIGMYRMFEVKITQDTPVVADVLKIEGDTVTLTNFNKLNAEGKIAFSASRGNIPKLEDGVTIKLAPDTVVYLWDWTKSTQPFAKVDKEEAKRRGYPTRYSVGSREDIMKNCYWVSFHSTRGDESVCDVIECYLNEAPGWE